MNTKKHKENLALKLAKDNIEVEQVKPLHIEYVKRLNYKYLPTCHKDGIRFMIRMTF